MKKRCNKPSRRIQAAAPSQIRAISMAGELSIQAAAAPVDGKPAGLPKFEIVAYTGVPMIVRDWKFPVVIDMQGVEIAGGGVIAVDLDHSDNIYDQFGQTTKVGIVNGSLVASGEVMGESPQVEYVLKLAKKGFRFQASVDGFPLKDSVEFVAAGKEAMVNGKTVSGPINIARRSRIVKIGVVVRGADEATATRVAAGKYKKKELPMNFHQWLKACGIEDPSKLTEEQTNTLRAAYDAANAAKGDPDGGKDDSPEGDTGKGKKPVKASGDPDGGEDDLNEDDADAEIAASRAKHGAETRRIAAIRTLTAKYKDARDVVKIEAEAIENGWNTDKVELHLVRASYPTGPAIHARERQGGADLARTIEASMVRGLGFSDKALLAAYGEKVVAASDSREFRQLGLHGLIHEVIRAAGGNSRPGRIGDSEIREAFAAEQTLKASGWSGVTLTGILGNVATKALLRGYESVEDITPMIAREKEVNDFKQFKTYRLNDKATFEVVTQSGELKHGTLTESEFPNQLKTYGKMLTLTRQDIINDDLGAFTDLLFALGRRGQTAKMEALFTLLKSNPSNFFHADNANLSTGAGSALSVGGITLAETLFLKMLDSAGKPIMLIPSVMLVPVALKATAEQLFKSDFLNETTTANAGKPTRNPHASKFKPVASPYLDIDPNKSAVYWYLLADPMSAAAMEVAYLTGKRTPTVETGDLNFNTLGIGYRGYFDFGVAMGDPKAAVRSNGS